MDYISLTFQNFITRASLECAKLSAGEVLPSDGSKFLSLKNIKEKVKAEIDKATTFEELFVIKAELQNLIKTDVNIRKNI